MAKAKKMDTKILIIAVVLVLAAVLVLSSGGLPGLTTTTTTIAPITTTTIAPTTTTTTVAGDTCDDVCLAADYSQGTCRPACLGYETRNDESGSDCTDIQKCCCK